MKKRNLKPIHLFYDRYRIEENCLNDLFKVRSQKGYTFCPDCRNPLDQFRPVKNRMAYQCTDCHKQLYPMANCILEHTRINLPLLFFIIRRVMSSKTLTSSAEIAEEFGIPQSTAYFILRKIHMVMTIACAVDKLCGEVAIDESYLHTETGLKKKHKDKSKEEEARTGRSSNDVLLLGMVEKNGNAICLPIDTAEAENLIPHILRYVDKDATIITDSWSGYNELEKLGYKHIRVKHKELKFKNGDFSSNHVESFWGNLKNGISPHGTVTEPELTRYIGCRIFQHNFRNLSVDEKFEKFLASLPPMLEGKHHILIESAPLPIAA